MFDSRSREIQYGGKLVYFFPSCIVYAYFPSYVSANVAGHLARNLTIRRSVDRYVRHLVQYTCSWHGHCAVSIRSWSAQSWYDFYVGHSSYTS